MSFNKSTASRALTTDEGIRHFTEVVRIAEATAYLRKLTNGEGWKHALMEGRGFVGGERRVFPTAIPFA
jgi:hypothetical protein